MVEINYLPPEAGKLPWTAGGLELLHMLQLESEKWSDPIHENNTLCNKSCCHFCDLVNRPTEKPKIPEFIMSGISEYPTKYTIWDEKEVVTLYKNLHTPMSELIHLLPRRLKGSISDKRYSLRKELGLQPLRRGGQRA